MCVERGVVSSVKVHVWKGVWSAVLKCVCVERGVVSSVKVHVWKGVWSAVLK